MRWRKLGRIFCPDRQHEWMLTHAANCAALRIDTHRYRIFFSSRDARNRASIGWVEIDIRRPQSLLAISAEPVLTPGPAGTFDDSGVSLACLLSDGGLTYLYYTGWNLGVTVPWRNSIGLAVSRDGLHFERVASAPVLDRNRIDPFSLSYPFVRRDTHGWRMWYGSNLRWGSEQRDMDHVIKYANGTDAQNWTPSGTICIGIERDDEYAFSRPCVVVDGALWRMWYSYRGAAYRIGYAESNDGIAWTRRDALAGITIGPDQWDSETVEYPWIVDHDGDRYLLYNGNGYGLTGFGIAILDRD